MHTVYLSLGSNIGDRAEYLRQAMMQIETGGFEIKKHSSVYLTEPVELHEQNWFLNCVVETATKFEPHQVLDLIRKIEAKAGRQRLVRSGPRTLDIDLLLFDAEIIHSSELEVPHPRMQERRFVLVPLCEFAPTLRHPVLQRTMAELLAECPDHSAVREWKPQESRN
jgi:2-amino-4-hydroxy-6-hydroxymethyldihydropteridine diphosphokinase